VINMGWVTIHPQSLPERILAHPGYSGGPHTVWAAQVSRSGAFMRLCVCGPGGQVRWHLWHHTGAGWAPTPP
jgi:hypothetical protein